MTFGTTSSTISRTRLLSVLFLVLMSLAFSIPANAFPQVHTVTFFENASGTDSVAAFETGTSSKALTLIQNMNPAIVQAGFTFDGWNTAADGSGVALVDGSTYS